MEAQPESQDFRASKPPGLVVWALLYFCLFSLKLPLFGGAVNGPALRVDDLLIAAAVPVLLIQARRAYFFRGHDLVLTVLVLFTGEGLLSSAWAILGRSADPLTAVAYALRPLEYGTFILVGFVIASSHQMKLLDRCLTLYSVYFTALCVLQVAGVNIAASQFDLSRAAANTSGPYEAAAVASLLFFYFIARRRWLRASLPLLGLLLTDSRITTVAVVISALVISDLSQRGSGRLIVKTFVASVVAAATIVLLLLGASVGGLGSGLATRLEQTQIVASWQEASAIRASTPVVRTPADYSYYAYDRLTALGVSGLPDASSVIRYTRWQIELKAWGDDPTAIAWGLGPSFGGAATDGYYVRLLVGQGVIGFILFCILMKRVWRLRDAFPGMKQYIIALAITGIFIDVFVSYRPMLLLWLGVGAALGQSRYALRAAQPAGDGRRVPSRLTDAR